RIRQQTLNKSLNAQLNFFASVQPAVHNIILLQEPHIDFCVINTDIRATHWYRIIYLPTHTPHQHKTRSAIFMNTALPMASWVTIPIASPDITAVQLHRDYGTIHIINIYNNCEHNDALN
ncbi:hypothetical protein B0H17DRAFT_836070, partial [Mycena rosella]